MLSGHSVCSLAGLLRFPQIIYAIIRYLERSANWETWHPELWWDFCRQYWDAQSTQGSWNKILSKARRWCTLLTVIVGADCLVCCGSVPLLNTSSEHELSQTKHHLCIKQADQKQCINPQRAAAVHRSLEELIRTLESTLVHSFSWVHDQTLGFNTVNCRGGVCACEKLENRK